MLKQVIDFKIDSKCGSNKLLVTGYNIKLSHVLQLECSKKVQSLEIFAANKLYIDEDIDKTGEKMQISFIAPIWEVVKKRKIVLNGMNGKPLLDERA